MEGLSGAAGRQIKYTYNYAPTLAKSLKSAGYATFFAGKWHLGPEGWWPEKQGFACHVGDAPCWWCEPCGK